MIRIGILGDIGSGKSYVAKNFGYPVFNADFEVGKLYKKNRKIFNKLKKVLPKYIYSFPINKNDQINLDFSKIGKNKFFYDVIYNPKETNFLKTGKKMGNEIENGKLMFIYQAFTAFKVWHGVEPEINNEVIKLLD